VKEILKPGGIFSFGLSASADYINPSRAEFLASIYKTLKEVFENVRVIPGSTAYFLSSARGVLSYDYGKFLAEGRKRKMDLKFVSEYFLFSKMSDERIKWMENILGSYAGVKINYDFHPVAYYYNLVFQAGRSGDSFVKKALVKITEAKIWFFAGILLFLVPVFRFLSRRKDNFVLLAVMTTGFSEIIFQLLVMISFQIIYGFLFYKIGIILTSFMVGLAFGSFVSVRNLHKMKNYFPAFIKTL